MFLKILHLLGRVKLPGDGVLTVPRPDKVFCQRVLELVKGVWFPRSFYGSVLLSLDGRLSGVATASNIVVAYVQIPQLPSPLPHGLA